MANPRVIVWVVQLEGSDCIAICHVSLHSLHAFTIWGFPVGNCTNICLIDYLHFVVQAWSSTTCSHWYKGYPIPCHSWWSHHPLSWPTHFCPWHCRVGNQDWQDHWFHQVWHRKSCYGCWWTQHGACWNCYAPWETCRYTTVLSFSTV